MIDSRIQTTHTYNENVARKIAQDIIQRYYGRFQRLKEKLEEQVKQ